jgi:hypothetical protein
MSSRGTRRGVQGADAIERPDDPTAALARELPVGVRAHTSGSSLRLTVERTPHGCGALILSVTIGCVLFFGGLLYALSVSDDRLSAVAQWSWGLFFAALFYSWVAWGLNRAVLFLRPGEIVIRYRPLPVPFRRRIDVDNDAQLVTLARERRVYEGDGEFSTLVWYQIVLTRGDGRQLVLVDGIRQQEQAVFTELEIARFLGRHGRTSEG